jgi:phospholipid/cholesterol/gamma-HCH transport system substrate-binding protein
MIRRSVKIQLIAFAVIIIAGVAYVGANYIGLTVPGHGPYTVAAYFRTTGGIYTNAVVSERGVEVGKVGSITLVKDSQGRNMVRVGLSINHGVTIPANGIQAKVADLSAVGEQYVDLEPATSTGPLLGSPGHTTIPVSDTQTPEDIGQIVLHLNQLLTSVNDGRLSDVIKELGAGFNHLGPILQHLIDNGDALTKAAIASLPSQLKLINDSVTVLDTQNQVANELKSYAHTFRLFSSQIDASDASLRGVIDNGIPAAEQLSKLLSENAPIFPTLLDNLITLQGIQAVRLPDVQAILELYPADTSAGFFVTPGNGTARFGQITDSSNPCGIKPNTDGFQTASRPNTPSGWGGDVNLSSYCHGRGIKTTKRGSRNVPKLVPDHANITGVERGAGNPATLHHERALICPVPYVSGLCGPKGAGATGPNSPGRSVAGSAPGVAPATSPYSTGGPGSVDHSGPQPVVTSVYNPKTGMVQGLDGKHYLLGYDGPTAPIFGSSSWEWLLLAPTMK